MDVTVPLTLMALGAVAVGLWDLVKSNGRDVLRVSGFLELGLVLGAVSQIVVPGGFLIGAIGGFALASSSFDRISKARAADLDARLAAAPDDATSLLAVHDRIDTLVDPTNGVRQAGVFLSLLFMLFLGLGLISMGLRYDIWFTLLLGSLVLLLPATQGTRFLADFEERRLLHERLTELEGHRPAVGAGTRIAPTSDDARVPPRGARK